MSPESATKKSTKSSSASAKKSTFNDAANLDEGAMWPTTFALKKLTDAEEAKISALVKKAAS